MWSNDYMIDEKDMLRKVLSLNLDTEELAAQLRDQELSTSVVFRTAACAFMKFIYHNWSPNAEAINLEEFLGQDWPIQIDVTTLLQCDSEPLYVNIHFPELLYLSSQLFNALYQVDQSLVSGTRKM